MRTREKQLRAASHKTPFFTGPTYTVTHILLLPNALFTRFALKAAAAAQTNATVG